MLLITCKVKFVKVTAYNQALLRSAIKPLKKCWQFIKNLDLTFGFSHDYEFAFQHRNRMASVDYSFLKVVCLNGSFENS